MRISNTFTHAKTSGLDAHTIGNFLQYGRQPANNRYVGDKKNKNKTNK
jgi:hypothetical protein